MKIVSPDDIKKNVEEIQKRIEAAARRSGRAVGSIVFLAVTKTVGLDAVKVAADAGFKYFGESYIKEAEPKIEAFAGMGVEWHLIGHLQSNKVNKAVGLFSMVQSLHSNELAQKISERALSEGRKMEVLLEVNLAGESTKSGFSPRELLQMIESVTELPGLTVCSLMCLPPAVEKAEDSRPYFKRLVRLADEIDSKGLPRWGRRFLSMGTSTDFEVAIEEGSNMVRLGRAIFGPK